MSLLLQADAITMVRIEVDDALDGKVINQYAPHLGKQDGQNTFFQIPSSRVSIQFLQPFKNLLPLALGTDFTVINARLGQLQYVVAPTPSDSFKYNFTFTWADDVEMDSHLNRAANELGYGTYHTDANTVPNSENRVTPLSDFPDGLLAALIYGGASKVAAALANRFAMKYDISAGDKHYSPSQMATAYKDRAETLVKDFLTARDDFYKGQGRQYRPSIAVGTQGSVGQGYILPDYTPKR